MKFLMILLVGGFSSIAFAMSPAEVISEYARVCHAEVGMQASISLSQAVHGAEPGSQEEADAKEALDNFNQELSAFVAFETGCNEALEGVEKFLCYTEGYGNETRRIAETYGVEYATTVQVTPECAYLNF